MDDNKVIVREFLNNCSIKFDTYEQLDGMLISRNTLLSVDTYNKVKGDIQKMKKLYSSGSLTSLQKNAQENQKWPLLNLVRQILKSNRYKMDPIRKSNGYTQEGKKKYLRYFIINKMNDIENDEQNLLTHT
tara:strand:- start:468 stop:860 length:393 start_codon:yes stop_codon:yes gene_type:complete